MAINTGGGSAVGGDASTGGGAFAGRDRRGGTFEGVSINIGDQHSSPGGDHDRQPTSTAEILEYLLILVDGSKHLGVVGIRKRLRWVWAVVMAQWVLLLIVLVLQIIMFRTLR
jgi:hypothetical protein